jgi:hypothetical protein
MILVAILHNHWNLLKIDCQVCGENWMSEQAYNLPVALWWEVLEDVVSLKRENNEGCVNKTIVYKIGEKKINALNKMSPTISKIRKYERRKHLFLQRWFVMSP